MYSIARISCLSNEFPLAKRFFHAILTQMSEAHPSTVTKRPGDGVVFIFRRRAGFREFAVQGPAGQVDRATGKARQRQNVARRHDEDASTWKYTHKDPLAD